MFVGHHMGLQTSFVNVLETRNPQQTLWGSHDLIVQVVVRLGDNVCSAPSTLSGINLALSKWHLSLR